MTKESTWELTPARQVMNVPVIFQTGSPACLTGGVDTIKKKKATVLPHVHFVYTCTHAHVCTHTIPITKRMPGSLNREKSSILSGCGWKLVLTGQEPYARCFIFLLLSFSPLPHSLPGIEHCAFKLLFKIN